MEKETYDKSSSKAAHWKEQINLWEQSGATQKEFCRNHKISVSVFGYWKRKLRPKQSDSVKFYPLAISTPPPSVSSGINLVTGRGKFHIELATDFVPSTLKTLLNTLEEI